MIFQTKPPTLSTVPMKSSFMSGPRWTRASYIKVHLAAFLPVIILIFYLASTSGSKHPDGPAGSGLVLLARQAGPIAIALIAFLVMLVVTFFATLGRLRDIDASPLFAFLLFVPGVVIPLMFFLAVVPGTTGKNKYGDDPREYDDITQNKSANVSKLDIVRNYATHKNTGSESLQKKQQDESAELLIDKHDVVKKILRTKELLKITKIRDKSGINSKVVCVGFDSTNAKYYLSISNVGTPMHEFKKQYFLNYQLMCSALFEQTNLLITELANEIS